MFDLLIILFSIFSYCKHVRLTRVLINEMMIMMMMNKVDGMNEEVTLK